MSIREVCWVFRRDIRPPAAKLLLVVIADTVSPYCGQDLPSMATMSQQTSMDAPSVERTLKRLENDGHLPALLEFAAIDSSLPAKAIR